MTNQDRQTTLPALVNRGLVVVVNGWPTLASEIGTSLQSPSPSRSSDHLLRGDGSGLSAAISTLRLLQRTEGS
jgi:hypothetical protein